MAYDNIEEGATVEIDGEQIDANKLSEAYEDLKNNVDDLDEVKHTFGISYDGRLCISGDGWSDKDVIISSNDNVGTKNISVEVVEKELDDVSGFETPDDLDQFFVAVSEGGSFGFVIPTDAEFSVERDANSGHGIEVHWYDEDDISNMDSWSGDGCYDNGAFVSRVERKQFGNIDERIVAGEYL